MKSASGNPIVELSNNLGSKTNMTEPINAILESKNFLHIR